MSSKRARRSGSDRGRSPPSRDVDFSQISRQISDALLSRLDRKAAEKWPKEYEGYLACPFTRRNPLRYANIPDCACTGHGFKNIADLKDHIKRVHSYRYGCSNCKERYQCRDNNFDEYVKKHKKACKYSKSKESLRLNSFKPEWMTREEDERYFTIDFRSKKHGALNVADQYFKICDTIWPGSNNHNLNIWSKPGDMVARCDIHEVFSDPDLIRCLYQIFGHQDGIAENGGGQEPMNGYYDSQASQAMMVDNPGFFNPTDASGGWQGADVARQDALVELNQLTTIPKPNHYAHNSPKDSAYWSSDFGGDKDKNMENFGGVYDPMMADFDGSDLLAGIQIQPGMPHYNSSLYGFDDLPSVGDLDLLGHETFST